MPRSSALCLLLNAFLRLALISTANTCLALFALLACQPQRRPRLIHDNTRGVQLSPQQTLFDYMHLYRGGLHNLELAGALTQDAAGSQSGEPFSTVSHIDLDPRFCLRR